MTQAPIHSKVTMRRRLGSWLNRAPGLKRALKSVSFWLRDPFGRGRELTVGGVAIRVPARFARQPWTDYERVSTTLVAGWLARNPSSQFLDVGCSVGVYSLLALATSQTARAWAFDSDLVSLKSTVWLCSHAGMDRLRTIHGFIAAQNESGLSAGDAAAQTAAALSNPRVPRDPEQGSYICLDGLDHPGTPTHSIDGLFMGESGLAGPSMLKIDVEGAELLVLKGASAFLRNVRPTLLISVHPATLQGFGFDKADVAAFLRDHGYGGRVIGIDHEEHWWYEPINS